MKLAIATIFAILIGLFGGWVWGWPFLAGEIAGMFMFWLGAWAA